MKKEQIKDTLGSINEHLFAIIKLLLDIRHDLIIKQERRNKRETKRAEHSSSRINKNKDNK